MKQSITIRLEPELLEQLKKQAAAEGRSISNLMQLLLAKGVAK